MTSVDLASAGSVAATYPVCPRPDGMTYEGGLLWIGSFAGPAALFDPHGRLNLTALTSGGAPTETSFFGDSVWVTSFADGTVTRLDAVTGAATAKIAVGADPVAAAGIGGEAGGDALWVFNQGDQSASVIDMATNAVTKTVPLGISPGFPFLADGGDVWVPDDQQDGDTVTILDGTTGAVRRTIQVGAGPVEVRSGFGSGWSADYHGNTVTRFDPETGAVQATIPIPGGSPQGLAVGGDAVWVVSVAGGEVERIDPATNTVTGGVATGKSPRDVQLINGDLYVDNSDDGTLVRIRPN